MSISPLPFQTSPVQSIQVNGLELWLKRDDLLDTYFSGNKARKFAYFLQGEQLQGGKIVGYGSAQANSLLSLAALAKLKQAQLDFYVQHLPSLLVANPSGNYQHALALGAKIKCLPAEIKGEQIEPYLRAMLKQNEPDSVLISEGGRMAEAKYGVAQLADEIYLWAKQQNLCQLNLVLPSGTGTTALFLQQSLRERLSSQGDVNIEVFTCPCVGSVDYLVQQFRSLSTDEADFPQIVTPTKKYHFGKLYRQCIEIWQLLLQQTQVEFELLYDPIAWLTIMPWLAEHRQGEPIMYLHQGGVLGNETMLARYRRKYPDLF
ncbi:1-aminocyclopropane-1-carboxylate deaminase/D-cysteine desulfhydrase [Motilimonas sp. KMU-193]|uniref:1-aminocyclopropane-1-carboxylate deaminase/D-cysteine desulfhydrase n=1 Tax=Motilimonas sp. KMU-193 TaxID=3388668 RepID=UPI00396B408B